MRTLPGGGGSPGARPRETKTWPACWLKRRLPAQPLDTALPHASVTLHRPSGDPLRRHGPALLPVTETWRIRRWHWHKQQQLGSYVEDIARPLLLTSLHMVA